MITLGQVYLHRNRVAGKPVATSFCLLDRPRLGVKDTPVIGLAIGVYKSASFIWIATVLGAVHRWEVADLADSILHFDPP